MEAFKLALAKALQEAKAGSKQKAMPGDAEAYDGDAMNTEIDSEKERAKSDLAPELKDDEKGEAQDEQMELGAEAKEQGLLEQILAALSDGSESPGRGPMGLKERAAANAKAKLNSMKK